MFLGNRTLAKTELGLDEAQWTLLYECHIIPCAKREEVAASAYIDGKAVIHTSTLQALPIVQQCITEVQEACPHLRGTDRALLQKHFIYGMRRWIRNKRKTRYRREQREGRTPAYERTLEHNRVKPVRTAANSSSSEGESDHASTVEGRTSVADTGAVDEEETSDAYKVLSSRSANPQRRFTQSVAKKVVGRADHFDMLISSSPIVGPVERRVPAPITESEGASVKAMRSSVATLADSAVVVLEETPDAYMSDRSARESLPVSKKPRRRRTLPTAVADAPGTQLRQISSDLPPSMNSNTNQPHIQYQAPQASQTHLTHDQPNNASIPAPVAPSVVTPEVATALAGIVPAKVLANPARLPAYLQVLQDLLSNGIPTTQWAVIMQGFHAHVTEAAEIQSQFQSKVLTPPAPIVLPVQEKEIPRPATSRVPKTAEPVAPRPRVSNSPLPTFIHYQRRLNFSDEEQAMHWPTPSVVSARPVVKAEAVTAIEEADQSNEPTASSPKIMSAKQEETGVSIVSPSIVNSPPPPQATQVSKRTATKRKRETVAPELVSISSSPGTTPSSVSRKEKKDSAVLEVPTTAESSVASMTFQAIESNVAMRPVSSTTQASSVRSVMSPRQEVATVPPSLLPTLVPPPPRQATRVAQRKHLPKRGTFFPTSCRAPTTAGSHVAPLTSQSGSNVAIPRTFSTTQHNVPSSQLQNSDLRPQPARETQAWNLFVTSDAAPGSAAYIEVESLVDKECSAFGTSLLRLSWNRFLGSLPPDFCPSVGSVAVLVACWSSEKRIAVWNCYSLSKAIDSVRCDRPLSMQIGVHIALQ